MVLLLVATIAVTGAASCGGSDDSSSGDTQCEAVEEYATWYRRNYDDLKTLAEMYSVYGPEDSERAIKILETRRDAQLKLEAILSAIDFDGAQVSQIRWTYNMLADDIHEVEAGENVPTPAIGQPPMVTRIEDELSDMCGIDIPIASIADGYEPDPIA